MTPNGQRGQACVVKILTLDDRSETLREKLYRGRDDILGPLIIEACRLGRERQCR